MLSAQQMNVSPVLTTSSLWWLKNTKDRLVRARNNLVAVEGLSTDEIIASLQNAEQVVHEASNSVDVMDVAIMSARAADMLLMSRLGFHTVGELPPLDEITGDTPPTIDIAPDDVPQYTSTLGRYRIKTAEATSAKRERDAHQLELATLSENITELQTKLST
jgi:hypothetical protein